MKTRRSSLWEAISVLLAFSVACVSSVVLASCGGSGSVMMPVAPGPNPNDKTNIVVLITSTANDQLVAFDVYLSSLTLTDRDGNTVTLYSNPNGTFSKPGEFMHLNGATEPLVAAAVPVGTYTSATATEGRCDFTNIVEEPNTLLIATFAEGVCDQGTGNATVALPNPIVVSGSAMVLSLDLQVSQSFTLTNETVQGPANYTISPVFTLALSRSLPRRRTSGMASSLVFRQRSFPSARMARVCKCKRSAPSL